MDLSLGQMQYLGLYVLLERDNRVKMVHAVSFLNAQHIRIQHGQTTIGWQPLCWFDGSNHLLLERGSPNNKMEPHYLSFIDS